MPASNDTAELSKPQSHEGFPEDGASGLEKAKKGGFDVVLCDIKMPKMDGMEVLEKLMAGRYRYAVSNQWALDWFNQRLLPERQVAKQLIFQRHQISNDT